MTPGIAATASRRMLLGLGAFAIVLSAYRWGIAPLAWVAPVPFLIVQRHTQGWRDRLLLLLIVAVASIIQVAKIITAPLPLVLAIPFALPSALSAWLLLVGTEAIRRHVGELAALVAFVALTGLAEWTSCVSSPLGMWGTGASTQVDNLVLLQFASVAGVPGIGMVMALAAAAIAMWLSCNAAIRHRVAVAAGVLIVGGGAWRLDSAPQLRTVSVAAVVIDAVDSRSWCAWRACLCSDLCRGGGGAVSRVAADLGGRFCVWGWVGDLADFASERGRCNLVVCDRSLCCTRCC